MDCPDIDDVVVEKRDGLKWMGEYSVVSTLSHGNYSKVQLVVGRDEQRYAMKQFHVLRLEKQLRQLSQRRNMTTAAAWTQIVNEIQLMRSFCHPNIIQIHKVMTRREKCKIYIVMDYMEKGEVMTYDPATKEFKSPLTRDGKLTEELGKQHFLDILNGVQYLHVEHQICHGDLKPANVLLNSDDRCCIIDYGTALFAPEAASQATTSRTTGTYHFMAPEHCCGSGETSVAHSSSSYAADLWALGIILYIFITNKLPFDGETTFLLFQSIQSQNPFDSSQLIERSCHWSTEALDLCEKLLSKDPVNRISLEAVRVHPWLNEEPPSF